ncbi:MAG: FAD-dependent oxidoreductase [Bacteroidota bacterium]
MRLRHEVTAIDRASRTVAVRNLETGAAYREAYDRLILATGSRPVRPPLPGMDLPGVFTLSTVEDAAAVREYARMREAHYGAVLGGGYIGLESAEALVSLGLRTALIERLPQVMPALSPEMAAVIAHHLRQNGVNLHLGAEAGEFLGGERLTGVRLRGGEEVPADLAIVAVGVRPELELAREAGLEVQEDGIVVDDRMRTSDPNIYAAGDIVQSRDLAGGGRVRIPLAGPANKQGRVAGANAAGGDLRFAGVVGASVVKVFDLTAGRVGLDEERARAAGFEPLISYTHSSHHATYYPGAEVMALKLVADRRSGKVLGAEIVGGAGVDKRLDVLATAVYAGLTVEDLEQLDLAYAPPYSSAKDPVVVAGMVAANLLRGGFAAVTPRELLRMMGAGERLQLVDVRTAREYQSGHLPGARHIPLDDLRERLGELDPALPTVVYCGIGYRSYHAVKILVARGFRDVRNLSGGISTWQWVGEVVK